MDRYDFIFAGGGLAGLSLAYQLCRTTFANHSMLILDAERPGSGDRTWSFWSRGDTPFIELADYSWPHVRFSSRYFSGDIDLSPYRYYTIQGERFFEHVIGDLESRSNVEFRNTRMHDVRDNGQSASVSTEHGDVSAGFVFDSRFDPAEYVASTPSGSHSLMQHFRGWIIETEEPAFDPHVATLFDFNVPQHNQMRFMYVLPFTRHQALVEFTLFSAALLEEEEYTENLDAYIASDLGISSFRVRDRERGVIPMTDRPFPRRGGDRVLNIGTRAGRVKASTGYAFTRIQSDTEHIVESLVNHGHLLALPRPAPGFPSLDTILLQIMFRRGELSERVFALLFEKNPAPLLLRFLDEETNMWETMRVMATVPWGPFIRAWLRTRVLGRI